MMKMSCVALVLATTLFLFGCGTGLYFGTATSVGLDVSGTSKMPDKISFAYDRAEVVIVPDDSSGRPHSVFASLDSEWTWLDGFYVSQVFATGEAAKIVTTEGAAVETTEAKGAKPGKAAESKTTTAPPGGNEPADSKGSGMPLLFVTGTKLGIAIEIGQTTSAPMSLLVGYRRAEMTLMPDAAGKNDIESVFADMTIDSRDITTTTRPELPTFGGVRIKQRIATGEAAKNAARHSEMRDKLRAAVYGYAVEEFGKERDRTDRKGAILLRFGRLDDAKKKAYVQALNALFGRTSAADRLTPDNFEGELENLNDTQLREALRAIEPL